MPKLFHRLKNERKRELTEKKNQKEKGKMNPKIATDSII